jgi:hypothetical protein
MKYDGNLGYKGAVTPLQRIMLARRSVRRYEEGGVMADHVKALLETHGAFCRKMGFSASRIYIEHEKRDRDRVMAAACSGLAGKGNPWLPITKAQAVMVLACETASAPVIGDRKVALAQAAMAMEAVLLKATELGLGTCWLAAINHAAIEKALMLPAGTYAIAMSTLGKPAQGISILSWDGMTYHLLSKKRKSLSQILFNDRLDNGYNR